MRRLEFTSLQVTNLETSKEFYVNKLGFKVSTMETPDAVIFDFNEGEASFAIRKPLDNLDNKALGNGVSMWFSIEEKIETLQATVNAVIEQEENNADAHPQAFYNKAPNPGDLINEVTELQTKWQQENLPLQEQNVIKDKLRYLQNRCDWVSDADKKQYIKNQIDQLWKAILNKV